MQKDAFLNHKSEKFHVLWQCQRVHASKKVFIPFLFNIRPHLKNLEDILHLTTPNYFKLRSVVCWFGSKNENKCAGCTGTQNKNKKKGIWSKKGPRSAVTQFYFMSPKIIYL